MIRQRFPVPDVQAERPKRVLVVHGNNSNVPLVVRLKSLIDKAPELFFFF